MSDEIERTVLNRQQEASVKRAPVEFDEAPGEAEADAMRDMFLSHAGHEPTGQATALANADSGLRARAVNRLQQERGNAYVQRVVAEARGASGRLVGKSQSEMVNEVLQRKGAGSELPPETQDTMGGFFGADMSGVRVHQDGEAATLSQELNAQAFTVGQDVFFAPGKYDPTSQEGQGLLAHELTHVQQQTGFGGQGVQREGLPDDEEQVQREAMPEEEEEETTTS